MSPIAIQRKHSIATMGADGIGPEVVNAAVQVLKKLTSLDGSFELEMAQIVPNFGQPHAHLAYDDGAFQTVFLRPVMPSARDTSVSANFVLAPA